MCWSERLSCKCYRKRTGRRKDRRNQLERRSQGIHRCCSEPFHSSGSCHHQLSLAIGKEGQNARLSAKLTGWRIDIKSETQARETNFLAEDPVEETEDAAEEMTEIMEDGAEAVETEAAEEIAVEETQEEA